jgi:DNA-binding NtrC family response regulator
MPACIVVVHDNPRFLDHLGTALKVKGHDAALFADPLEAWDALEQAKRVEVLVTRIQFAPGRSNGAALARMARSKRPEIRILFIALPKFASEVAELGEFMPYPSNPSDVVAAVKRLLDQPPRNPYRPSRAD